MKPKVTLLVKGNLIAREDVLSNTVKDNIISVPEADESAFDISEAVIIHGDVTLDALDSRNGGLPHQN